MKYVVDAANGLRERKKVQTREAIIDAALDLFERQGFDATTIDDIAAAADVSPRTFFRYFDSKVDLVMARHAARKQPLGALVAARPADEAPIEALRHVVEELLVERLDDPAVRREFQVMMTAPSLRNMAREHFYEEEADLVRAFAARLGVDEGDLAPHVMAGAAASAFWTIVDRWLADGADIDRLPGMLDAGFGLLERGFAAGRPGALGRPARPPTRAAAG